jgi:hypothetical protein
MKIHVSSLATFGNIAQYSTEPCIVAQIGSSFTVSESMATFTFSPPSGIQEDWSFHFSLLEGIWKLHSATL